MQGLDRAHHALHALPQGGHWAPFWAFCYVITDLRIYPPPSTSHAPTRSRASPNQVTAGKVSSWGFLGLGKIHRENT